MKEREKNEREKNEAPQFTQAMYAPSFSHYTLQGLPVLIAKQLHTNHSLTSLTDQTFMSEITFQRVTFHPSFSYVRQFQEKVLSLISKKIVLDQKFNYLDIRNMKTEDTLLEHFQGINQTLHKN